MPLCYCILVSSWRCRCRRAALKRRPRNAGYLWRAAVVSLAALRAVARRDHGAGPDIVLPLGLPWLGAHFRLDALAAAFLSSSIWAALGASLYASATAGTRPSRARVLPFYPAFLAAMNLVVLAADAYSFLFAWELMSLASWALVMARHRDAGDSLRAGLHLSRDGERRHASRCCSPSACSAARRQAITLSRRCAAHHLSPGLAALVLALVVYRRRLEGGLVPLHVWLPLAHPAAPSHVSALMSGVMTKVAIYAFIRIVFDLLGPPTWWWGVAVLVLGGVTAVLGVLYALMETRPEAPARLQHDREYRHHLHRPRPGSGVQGERSRRRGGAGADRRAVPRVQPHAVQEPAVLRRRQR